MKKFLLLFLSLNLTSNSMEEIFFDFERVNRSYLIYIPEKINLNVSNNLLSFSLSQISPSIKVYFSMSTRSRFFILPAYVNLSKITMWYSSSSIKCLTKLDPIKPQPPVTKIFFKILEGSFAFSNKGEFYLCRKV